MTKIFSLLSVLLISCAASAQTKTTPPIFKSALDSASYAFGANIAADLKERGVTEINTAMLSRAMNDVFGSQQLSISQEKSLELIQAFLKEIDKKKFEINIAEEKRFLDENKKRAGVTVLPSGLQYEVIVAGNGARPKATDKVTVHYQGKLASGQEFDSSYKRGEPISLGLNQVIRGWTEGLQLMPVGSKYRLFIPSSLGYGEIGGGDAIPPYSALIFEVELISIDGTE